MVRLKDIAKITAGQAAPKEFTNTGLPFIRAGHLEDLLSGLDIDSLPKVSEKVARTKRLKRIPKGTILFAKSGMSATKNRVYITGADAYFVSHLAGILPNTQFSTSYLSRFLSWYNPSKLILDSAYPSIRLEDINNLKIPLPPLDQQKQIASILDTADAYRQKTKALIDKYDALTQSLFLDMFGDSWLNPNNFPLKMLRDLVNDGKIITYGIVQAGEHIDNGIPYIRTGDIKDGKIITKGLKRTSNEIAQAYKRSKCSAGDIIMSIRATVGTIAFLPNSLHGANLTQGTARISTDKNKANPIYLFHCIKSEGIQLKINRQTKGATFREITLTRLRTIKVPIPPLVLQNQFAERIKAIEAQKALAQKELNKADELFNSLLQQAFKGELV